MTRTTRQPAADSYHELFLQLPVPVWVYDPGTLACVEVNAAAVEAFGYSREEFLAMTITEIHPAEILPLMNLALGGTGAGTGGSCQSRQRAKQGHCVDVEMDARAVRFHARPALLVTVQDVTAHKKTEHELQASESTLKLFIDLTPAAIAMFDRDMKYIAASRRFYSDYRLADRDIIGRSHYDIFPEISPQWKEIHNRCLAGAVERAEEDPFPRTDGSLDWVRWEIHPWFTQPGEIGGIILLSEVITERKNREKLLRDSEAVYRSLVESSNSVIATLDADGIFHFVNRIAGAQLGRSPAEIVGRNVRALFPPEIAERQMQTVGEVLDGNAGKIVESFVPARGGMRWYINNIQPIRDASGAAVLALVNAQDITERKEMEVKIRESEARLSAIFQNSPLGIVLTRLTDGMIIDANPAFAAMHGYSCQEMIGRPSSDLGLWAVPGARDAMIRELLERGRCKDLQIKTTKKSGETRDLMISVELLDLAGERYTLGLGLDITERKKVDEELQFRNLMLSTQAEASLDGILVVDDAIRILSHNRRFAEMWGIPPRLFDDPSDEPLVQFVAAQTVDPAEFLTRVKYLYAHRQETSQDFVTLKNGKVFDRFSAPMIGPDERYYGRVWYFRDITDRKRAEAELMRLHQKEELILSSAAEGVLGLDGAGNHTFVNPAAARMLGYEVGELIGRAGHAIWHSRSAEGKCSPGEECMILASAREGHTRHVSNEVFWRKDGTSFPVEYASTPIMEQGSVSGTVVTFADITERKRSEEHLVSSLREKEILLREIHHRVKNNLQVICSLLNLQAAGVTDGSIRTVLAESQGRIRAMALVHEKLYRSENLAQINFGDYLRSVAEELGVSHGREGVTTTVEAEPILMQIDTAVPCGLMVNELITNALKHAFPAGRKGSVKVTLVRAGDSAAELGVHDDGVGFPFETALNQETTMGMMLIHSLAVQISGTIRVTGGGGTHFVLTFPV